MSRQDISINPRILESAKKEFLLHGYEKASTNVICKNAGVTWGALAKRYSGKDELFCSLVAPIANQFKIALQTENDRFHSLSYQEQEIVALGAGVEASEFVDYIYDNFDVFRLLIVCAKGSSYENYLDELVEILVTSTVRFMEESNNKAIILGQEATLETIHVLISSYLHGYFEPIIHGMSREKARLYVNQLKYFFNVGWSDILRLK